MFGNQFAMLSPKLFMGAAKFVIDHGIFGKDLHSYDDQEYRNSNCKWLANNSKNQKLEIIL